MPAIVAAAAEPFARVGQLTVLNGGEGINNMVGGILAQVGNYLPALTAALKDGKSRDGKPAKPQDPPHA